MKRNLLVAVAALALVVVLTGCESDNASSRIQEKSAVYATLEPWQKRKIDKGIVAVGLTPDMVYMAIGNPSSREPVGTGELWIYKRYYPSPSAEKVLRTLNTEPNPSTPTAGGLGSSVRNANATGDRNGGNLAQSGMQGGSMEPADVSSYTLRVTFEGGVVKHLKLEPNL